jgi:hypothetical protein
MWPSAPISETSRRKTQIPIQTARLEHCAIFCQHPNQNTCIAHTTHGCGTWLICVHRPHDYPHCTCLKQSHTQIPQCIPCIHIHCSLSPLTHVHILTWYPHHMQTHVHRPHTFTLIHTMYAFIPRHTHTQTPENIPNNKKYNLKVNKSEGNSFVTIHLPAHGSKE